MFIVVSVIFRWFVTFQQESRQVVLGTKRGKFLRWPVSTNEMEQEARA